MFRRKSGVQHTDGTKVTLRARLGHTCGLFLFSVCSCPKWGMHPPLFRRTHRLSDWPECVIELHCLHCRGGSVLYPVRLLIKSQGDMTFENLPRRLRCKRCRAVKPPSVYLVAGHHRTASGGPDPDWSIELVPPAELKR
jgi:hypothetical protein